MLSLTVRLQGFEAIARRNAKVTQHPRLVKKPQFSQSDILNICG
jgi:hypothetical protein